jgi:hypothetical protein
MKFFKPPDKFRRLFAVIKANWPDICTFVPCVSAASTSSKLRLKTCVGDKIGGEELYIDERGK